MSLILSSTKKKRLWICLNYKRVICLFTVYRKTNYWISLDPFSTHTPQYVSRTEVTTRRAFQTASNRNTDNRDDGVDDVVVNDNGDDDDDDGVPHTHTHREEGRVGIVMMTDEEQLMVFD